MKLEISKSLRLKVTRGSGLRGYGTKESGLVNGLASESSSMEFERKNQIHIIFYVPETNIISLRNCCWFLKIPIDCCCLGGGYNIWLYIPVTLPPNSPSSEHSTGMYKVWVCLLSKCQGLICIVWESNPGRPRCRRALYLKSCLHCKKRWRKTRLCFSSSVLC